LHVFSGVEKKGKASGNYCFHTSSKRGRGRGRYSDAPWGERRRKPSSLMKEGNRSNFGKGTKKDAYRPPTFLGKRREENAIPLPMKEEGNSSASKTRGTTG